MRLIHKLWLDPPNGQGRGGEVRGPGIGRCFVDGDPQARLRAAYCTITLPRSMPIWHWNGISPRFSGVNSMVTVSPSGSLAD
ncbi:MAG: hypothetical protein BMS9Abin28_1507 [Anaerolineae bacterium]|nr:MAG: hypothetical protein BMS9Abin28_1507 [Anaerolineae bacterium]